MLTYFFLQNLSEEFNDLVFFSFIEGKCIADILSLLKLRMFNSLIEKWGKGMKMLEVF